MKELSQIILIILILYGCNSKSDNQQKDITNPNPEKIKFNQDLANELKKMAEVDQIAAYIPQGEYKKMTKVQWNSFQDSVFTTHKNRIKQIFEKYGFVGFDLVGEEGSQNFWLMVQHSDHDPDFQKVVLEKMEIELYKKNVKPSNYGLLVDRVRLNSGEKQIFGTQVSYNMETGQAYPKNLEDSLNVNKRRKSIGLEPIEVYLNVMTEMHFEMNKKNYTEKGITEPKLYKTD